MKKNRIKQALAFAALMTWAVLPAVAGWSRSGSVLTNDVSGWAFNLNTAGDTVSSVKTVGTGTAIDFSSVAADTDGGCVITAFADNSLSGRSTLTAVTLPGTLTTIGYRAFFNCANLTTVTPLLPDSVTSVGGGAFQSSPLLEGSLRLVNPAGVTVRDSAFLSCSLLVDANLSGVTTLASSAFSGCSGLTNVVLGSGLTTIGYRAFFNCANLTTVTPLLPDSVTNVGESAFQNCSLLKGTLFATNALGVTFQGSAFFGSAITNAHLNVNGVVPSSLVRCTSLSNVYFYGVTPQTFGNESIKGPSSYQLQCHVSTKRGDYRLMPGYAAATPTEKGRTDYPGDGITLGAFQPQGCNRQWLVAWTAPGDDQPDATLTVNSQYGEPSPAAGTYTYVNQTPVTLSAPSFSVGLTSYTCTGWTGTGDILASGTDNSVRVLLTNAASSITWNWDVVTHEKTWIRNGNVLSNAVNNWSFELSSSAANENLMVNKVLVVGMLATADIDFRSVQADTGCVITSFKGNALQKPLTSVAFPDSVTTLGSYVCGSVTTLTNVVLGAGMTTVSDKAFTQCTALTTVTPLLPDSVTTVGLEAFNSCPVQGDLRLVNPSGVTVGSAAFSLANLSTIDASGVVEMTGTYNFSQMSTLTSVVLGPGLQTIPEKAFTTCPKFQAIVFGSTNAVVVGGANAFAACPLLTNLTFWGSAPTTANLDLILTGLAKNPTLPYPCVIYASTRQSGWKDLAALTEMTEDERGVAPANCFGVYSSNSKKAWLVKKESPYDAKIIPGFSVRIQ